MENYLRTGRPLQIEALAYARNKVTLGFKCDAGTKMQLASEAQQNGMTLSEYVDTLVQLRHKNEFESGSKESNSLRLADEKEIEELKSRVVNLQERLFFYEQNTLLVDLFKTYQGKKVPFTDAKGRQRKITINSISDAFSILILSFTPKSHD